MYLEELKRKTKVLFPAQWNYLFIFLKIMLEDKAMIHCFLEMRWIIVNANLAYKHFTVGKVNVIISTFQMTKLSLSNVYILHYCKKCILGLLVLSICFE